MIRRFQVRFFISTLLLATVLLMSGPQPSPAGETRAESPPDDLTEMSLESLMNVTVYGASKFDQKLSEAPSSVSIITADEIKKYGYRNLADILRSMRGFIVTNDRAYSYVAVRGFGRTGDYNSRILILVDGHRMNEITYDSVYIANEFILDADLIDHIEIIRGPSSSLYGDNAFFAIINIFTRRGRDFRGVELAASAGSLETYKGRTSYGNRFGNNSEMVLSGTALDSKGEKHLYFREFDQNNPGADPRAGNNGVADNLDYEKHHSFLAKYSSGEVALEGAYVERDKGIPTASYGAAFNDSRNHTLDSRAFLDLKYEHEFADGFKMLARVYYDQMWYHADLPYPDSLTPSVAIVNYDQVKTYWMGTELQLTKELGKQHRIVAGVEYQDNMEARFENHDESPYFQYIDSNRRSTKWALYAQDEFRIAGNLILNAGGRYDHYETFGATTNPRLGLIYNPVPKSTIKFLFGTAFRSPNAYELYYDAPAYGVKGNPDLEPEKITTTELVYEQNVGDHYLMTFAGFENHIKGLIVQETDPVDNLLVFQNKSDVKARGIEAELEGKWENGYRHRLSYTYSQAKDEETGEIMVNSPEHMVKANAIFPIVEEHLFAGLEVQYMSRRKTVTDNYAGSVVLTNVTLVSQKLLKGLEVSGVIYNLFDKQYGDPGGPDHQPLDVIPQDGRTYRVKLTYRF